MHADNPSTEKVKTRRIRGSRSSFPMFLKASLGYVILSQNKTSIYNTSHNMQ